MLQNGKWQALLGESVLHIYADIDTKCQYQGVWYAASIHGDFWPAAQSIFHNGPCMVLPGTATTG